MTIPKAIADQYGIAPGDEIQFMPAGEAIRVQPPPIAPSLLGRDRRLERFDKATERQRARQGTERRRDRGGRGWRREGLYERGSAR